MTNDLRPITLDYIKELRANGQGRTASDLLAAYYASSIKGRKQDRVELRRNEARKAGMIKRYYGICRYWGCEKNSNEGKSMCEQHRITQRELNRKSIDNKKNTNSG